jgi:L-asparaginase II
VDNPILVEVTRGPVVESRHRGAVAVVDADGRTVLALGSVDDPVFPRSAVKAIQAVPLLESGIADRFGLTEAEIALACASHAGEPEHVATAAAMLARVGRDEACLECGAHWPFREEAVRALAAQGRAPTALHNNCSGKHAGFVCLACGLGDVTGAAHQAERCGIDGCSIPTYAVPLTALARGFARFGTGSGLSPSGAEAARRIRAAVARHPFMVAGTDQFDTRVMAALGERAFVKGGAEGVFCAAFPELGYGLALKIDDGGTRAAETAMANLVLRFLALADDERAAIAPLARPAVRNRNGFEVGRVRAAGPLV